MTNDKPPHATPFWFWRWSPTLACFTALYAFLLVVVDPPLFLHGRITPFFLGQAPLTAALNHPGGLRDYGAAFAVQLCELPWLGALLATGLGLGSALMFRRLLTVAAGRPPLIAHLLPVCCFAPLLAEYRGPWMAYGIMLALSLAVTTIAWSVPRRLSWVRQLVFVLLSALCGYAGGWTVVASATAACVILEIAVARKPATAVATVITGVGLSLLTWKFPGATGLPAPGNGVPGFVSLTAYAMIVVTPVVLAVVLMPLLGHNNRGGRGVAPLHATHQRRDAAATLIGAIVMVAFTVILTWTTFDHYRKAYLKLDHLLENECWEELLATPEIRVMRAPLVTLAVGRALAETGQLADKFFAYPQNMTQTILPNYSCPNEVLRQYAALMLELGHIEEANHFASEALELEGELPMTLKLLARIFILKGRPEAARVYLHRLRLSLHDREWCDRILTALDHDPTLANEPGIGGILPLLVTEDRLNADSETLLSLSVSANPANRQAFEYLVMLHLSEGQMDKFTKIMPLLERVIPAGPLPRHIEEAVLYIAAVNGAGGMNPIVARIRPETVARFSTWVNLIQSRNERLAQGSAAEDESLIPFGDTFWYYLTFKQNPGSPRP